MNSKHILEMTKDMSVLYVEDDMKIQESMLRYLSKFFSFVASASNGQEALDEYKKKDFDIVITDLSMPVMNGIEMIEEMKKQNENQSIIITTAHTQSDYMLSAIKDGVDGYIIKPFDFTQLNTEIFKVAQKIHMLKENETYKFHLNEMVREKTHALEDMIELHDDNYQKTLISMIEMIEQRDTYTAGHSTRVALYSKKIAKEMGYSDEECTLVYQAGILHDVGKIGTPDAVLLNPKSLNDLEYKLIQGHVSVSYKLLHSIPMFKALAEIVYSHHERYDGKGYPRGLKNQEILPLGRIIIVADAFDAMTTNRIYKSRKSIEEGIQELISLSAKQFDPEVVKSAVIALENIVIDATVNQLPQTKLEEEKFAYFYKDTLSEAYNQNYLDVVLMKNKREHFFSYMKVISLKGFSAYNKKNGWKEGDTLLKTLANSLVEFFDNSYVFRVFGDDFVLMSELFLPDVEMENILNEVLQENSLVYKIDSIDLSDTPVEKLSQIEGIQINK